MNRKEPLGIQRGGGSEYSPELESPFASGQDRGEEDAEEHHRDVFDTLLDIREAENVMEDVELGPMLGTGSYGKVYLGHHAFHGNVAVKVIPIERCSGLEQLYMEVKTGLDVRHANVAVLHEWRVVHTKYYYVSSGLKEDGSSSFCDKASSSHGPDVRYHRLQGLRHCLYLSNCSAGFSRMSSSNGSSSSTSSNHWAQEAPAEMQDNGCDCNICSNAWTELWLIQELCPLGTLAKAIERRWFAEIGQEYSNKVQSVVKIALDIAKGVAALHERDVIHGDLSSNNVMLACDGDEEVKDEICLNPWTTVDVKPPPVMPVAKLIDFGRSKSIQPCTQHTDSLCTLPYMSPERMSDGTVTPAADTYSFGVLVWELWSNVLAWCGILPAQIIVQRSMGKGLDIPLDAPAELQQLMRDCLAEDGHMRPLMSEVVGRLTSMQP